MAVLARVHGQSRHGEVLAGPGMPPELPVPLALGRHVPELAQRGEELLRSRRPAGGGGGHDPPAGLAGSS